MPYTNTGYKRSMKITVTKNGDDGSSVPTIYDGQEAFGAFLAIPSDDDFRRLERNGVDADWDVRLAAFKLYVESELGQEIYDSLNIDWGNLIIPLTEYTIKIMAIYGTQGTSIVAVAYNSSGLPVSLPETVDVQFDTLDKVGVPLQIISGNYISYQYDMDQADGDIQGISNASISVEVTNNGIYSVIIDTINEWA